MSDFRAAFSGLREYYASFEIGQIRRRYGLAMNWSPGESIAYFAVGTGGEPVYEGEVRCSPETGPAAEEADDAVHLACTYGVWPRHRERDREELDLASAARAEGRRIGR